MPSVINCTIAGNNAGDEWGLYGDGVTGQYSKTVWFWNNSSRIDGGIFSFEYCLAQGMPAAGTGNLDSTIAYGGVFASPVAYGNAPPQQTAATASRPGGPAY